ncbi:hypothetical protein BJ508DRAFT_323894 [Ascobolus immersus RN42]|uniref:Uncharacterized protein n=1 Tax=Ascobolus immersus RN42 TaxID=1160509 RepID=A0A3N4IDN9_ASCIM|nr:hypothetical protein BJ508DRAFT_323894 [Ascobolus immersus RN42]
MSEQHYIWEEYLSEGSFKSLVPWKLTRVYLINESLDVRPHKRLSRVSQDLWIGGTGYADYRPFRIAPEDQARVDARDRKEQALEREDWRKAVSLSEPYIQASLGLGPRCQWTRRMLIKRGVLRDDGKVRYSFAEACALAQA